MKSYQNLSIDLLEIIDFPITNDRSYPLAKMVAPGTLRSLPTVEMTKMDKVEMTAMGKVEMTEERKVEIEMGKVELPVEVKLTLN